jgi:hypothetical protein
MPRKKGSLNKTTAVLKDAIIAAAAKAGGGSLEAYLTARAQDENKGPFMGLLGRVVPLQHEGNAEKPIQHKLQIEFVRADEK